ASAKPTRPHGRASAAALFPAEWDLSICLQANLESTRMPRDRATFLPGALLPVEWRPRARGCRAKTVTCADGVDALRQVWQLTRADLVRGHDRIFEQGLHRDCPGDQQLRHHVDLWLLDVAGLEEPVVDRLPSH